MISKNDLFSNHRMARYFSSLRSRVPHVVACVLFTLGQHAPGVRGGYHELRCSRCDRFAWLPVECCRPANWIRKLHAAGSGCYLMFAATPTGTLSRTADADRSRGFSDISVGSVVRGEVGQCLFVLSWPVLHALAEPVDDAGNVAGAHIAPSASVWQPGT